MADGATRIEGGASVMLAPVFEVTDLHRGVVTLQYADRSVALRFDWFAVAKMQKRWGKPEYLRVVANALEVRDVEVIGECISFASDGQLTVREVMEWAPPIIMTMTAVERGWLIALFGPAMRPTKDGEKAEPGKQTNPFVTFFKSLLRRASARASAGNNSGD